MQTSMENHGVDFHFMIVFVYSDQGLDGFLHVCGNTLPESWQSQAYYRKLSSKSTIIFLMDFMLVSLIYLPIDP